MPQAKTDLSWIDPVYQTTKDKAAIVTDAASRAGFFITREYFFQTSMDHVTKLCVDFMHYNNAELRDWLRQFLHNHKDALGIQGIISWDQVMGFPSQGAFYRGPEGVWRPYSGPNPHHDHVHTMFNLDKALVAQVPTPHPKPEWSGQLWALNKAEAFDGNGHRRPELDLDGGHWYDVTVDTHKFDDGRYVKRGHIPHTVWYPLDNGTWSHEKNGVALRESGASEVKLADLSDLVKAAKLDPERKQGGTTKGSVADVKVVEWALQQEGLLSKKYALDGSFGSTSIEAYKKWQKKCGYTGSAADGIPGEKSLTALGKKHGFKVKQ